MRLIEVIAVLFAGLKVASGMRSSRGISMDENLLSPSLSNPNDTSLRLPEEKWFEQHLDHFNRSDTRTWKQRYFINDTFHEQGGPIFLLISGESAASPKSMLGGQWILYAKQYGALCFQLEHRFYGKSRPTADLSAESLAYLSSRQALGDLANFIERMNKLHQIPAGTKWIVFGGSYAGSLAAWSRAKYPHLIHGAVSSSAPLLAKVDFREYYGAVADSLRTHSQDCVDAVAAGYKEIGNMLRDQPLGPKAVSDLFRLCNPIKRHNTTSNDISFMYSALADEFASVVQYNGIGSKRPKIDTICDMLVDEERGTPVVRLANMSNFLLNSTGEKCLNDQYSKTIEALRNVTWEAAGVSGIGARQWTYQTCTEFGFFQTSSARPQIFGNSFPVKFFIQECTDIFGPGYNSRLLMSGVRRTNQDYGGLDLKVTNVVHVHGSIDPWHKLGITKSSNPQAPAIFIEGTAHTAILSVESKNDPPQLIEARKEIGQLIGHWLKAQKLAVTVECNWGSVHQ